MYREKASESTTLKVPLPEGLTYSQRSIVYKVLSFGLAAMGSATVFFWLQLPNAPKDYPCTKGLLNGIFHYGFGDSHRDIPLRADLQLLGGLFLGGGVEGSRRLRRDLDGCTIQRCLS